MLLWPYLKIIRLSVNKHLPYYIAFRGEVGQLHAYLCIIYIYSLHDIISVFPSISAKKKLFVTDTVFTATVWTLLWRFHFIQ